MSLNYLQGLFFMKSGDPIGIEDLKVLFAQNSLKSFDALFRNLMDKKFPSQAQKRDFLEKDVQFSLKAVREQKGLECRRFLQGLTLPFDYYNLSILLEGGSAIENIPGFFSVLELKEIIQGKSSLKVIPETEEFINNYKKLKTKREKDRYVFMSIRRNQPKVIGAQKFHLIDNYFKILHFLDEGKIEQVKRFLPFKALKFLPQKQNYEKELFKFYLPWLAHLSFIEFLTNPFEFVFIHLHQRFVMWKVLDQYIL